MIVAMSSAITPGVSEILDSLIVMSSTKSLLGDSIPLQFMADERPPVHFPITPKSILIKEREQFNVLLSTP